MKRYLFTARLAFLRRLRSPVELFGRIMLFCLILFIWSRLWLATDFGYFRGFTAADAVWYLAATEWVVLSVPYQYLEIEADVRAGDVAFQFLRPGHYAGYQLAMALGAAFANWVSLGIVAMPFAWLLTGAPPAVPLIALLPMAISFLAAIAVCAIVMVALGLGAIWTTDASPLAWVWQKLHFVLGGLMLPLMVYPSWLQSLANWTPFPHLLGNLAAPLARGEAVHSYGAALRLAASAVVFGALLALISSLASRRVREG